MKKHTIFLILLSCVALFSFSKTLENDKKKHFQNILKSYESKNNISMKVQKRMYQPLIKRQSQSQGQFYYSEGLWKFAISHPNKVSLIFDGKKLYQVSNNTVRNFSLPHPHILSLIFDTSLFFKSFNYLKTRTKGRTNIHDFSPKSLLDLKKLSIQTEKDRILSIQITWNQNLGKEYYKFTSIQFNKKLPKKLFKPSIE